MSSVTPTPLINCDNKDDYDILSLLLNLVWLGSDGLLYLKTDCCGGSGAGITINSQQVDIPNGTTVFALVDTNGDPYTASIIQFYSLVAGTYQNIVLDFLLTGTTLIVNNAGPDLTNIVIKFI